MGFSGLAYYNSKHPIEPVTIEKTKYIKGETIKEVVPIHITDLRWYELPSDTTQILEQAVAKGMLKREVDTIFIKQDTLNIMKDWASTRSYEKTLFDNDSGRCDVSFDVQYNQLNNLQYSFTPIYRETIVQRTPLFSPFFGVGVQVTGKPLHNMYVSLGTYVRESWGVQVTADTNKDLYLGITKKF